MELVSPKGSRWAAAGEGGWSHAQNKQFEDALAVFDKDTPDRWQKVAAIIPGKSVGDIIRHYQELEDDVGKIEAGLLPESGGEKERKKGVPWTQEEHKLFLMGLKKHGRGDWRNISRNFVVTRTPTQVASHAQKYFIRQVSGAKDKRRASIHDITTSTLHSQATPSYASPSANSHYPPPSAAYPEYGMNPYGMSMCNGYHHNIGF